VLSRATNSSFVMDPGSLAAVFHAVDSAENETFSSRNRRTSIPAKSKTAMFPVTPNGDAHA
jgi:hypothetical protein